jgi:2'-hydroxyisoflavone reductase
MHILIIGGGVFVGRALIEAALQQGHQVTAFSRGNSPLPRADEIQSIVGDRNTDLSGLAGQQWDAVIDTCAYRPEEVRSLLDAIGSRTKHYTLISSVSTYADPAKVGLTENDNLSAPLEDPGPGITAKNYGPLKAAAEQIAATFPQSLIVRPGIIAGPNDPTDRFTYWVNLIEYQSPILIPTGLPEAPVQIIDVRDLAEWIITQIGRGTIGPFNAIGPAQPITMGQMLASIANALGRDFALSEKSAAELTKLGADPEKDFPLHIPVTSPQGGLFQISGQKAWSHGLHNRPTRETAEDIASWFNQHRTDTPKVGWPSKQMAAAIKASS